jgi:Spy/CpxP family protein refolding chaperone
MVRQAGMALTVLAAAVTMAVAQPAKGPRGERAEHRMANGKAMMEKLDLTDQQRTDLAKARLEFQKQQIELQAKIRIAQLEMREQMLADKPDRSVLEKGLKTESDLEYKAKLNRLDHMLAMRSVLTPEQQKKMKGMMWHRGGERMRGERGDMMGDQMGGPMGLGPMDLGPMDLLGDEGQETPEPPDAPPGE